MITVSYTALLHLLLPEVIVIAAALLALTADLLISRTAPARTRFATCAVISGIGCIGAITQIMRGPQQANIFNGTFVIGPETQLVQTAILILTVFIVVLSIESSFTTHFGEYFAVIL